MVIDNKELDYLILMIENDLRVSDSVSVVNRLHLLLKLIEIRLTNDNHL